MIKLTLTTDLALLENNQNRKNESINVKETKIKSYKLDFTMMNYIEW